MSKISQHISNIRSLINSHNRDNKPYTDQFLYEVLVVCRNTILKQKLDRFHAISESNWISFCMAMEPSKSHNCDCVPASLDCLVLKSKWKIPDYLQSRNKSQIKIKTVGGKIIHLISETAWMLRKNLSTTEYYGSIINGYLFVWNAPLTLKVIEISGVWANPIDLQEIPNCNTQGEVEGTCFDLDKSFPLQTDLASTVYLECLKFLQIAISIPLNSTNNSNEKI